MTGAPAFAPDSPLVAVVRPSPNHGERVRPSPRQDGECLRPSLGEGGERLRPSPGEGGERAARPDAIVLHYTGMADGPSAIARLRDPVAEVSCHYVVEEDGTVVQLVAERRRAWHAGRGSWAGETDINSASIGIEIVNGGHDFGLPAYPEPQIGAVIALCRDIVDRRGIALHRILAHSDIAPGRKIDPGEHFPWERLAAAGVGLWVPPSDDVSTASDPAGVAAFQVDLAAFGYGIVPTGRHDAASRTVVEAFQRRHRPARIDGAIDPGTRDTLARLVALLARVESAAR